MSVRALKACVLSMSLVGLALLGASCRGATSMRLRVLTDLPCTQVRGVAITAGSPASSVERDSPSTVTQKCGPGGEIGTLVLTPEQAKDGEIGVKVVMGVDKDVSQCQPDMKGCIVARRQIAYVPREEIELPIYMLLVCIGVPCDEKSTCAANGKCVDKRVSNPAECAGRGCFPDDDPAGQDAAPPVQSEAGWDGYNPPVDDSGNPIVDSGSDGAADAGGSDSGDAGSDGPTSDDGGPPATGNALWCANMGNPQATCPPGNFCCWKDPMGGRCAPTCNPDEIDLACTSQQDCMNRQDGRNVCCPTGGPINGFAPRPAPGGQGSRCEMACPNRVCSITPPPPEIPLQTCPIPQACNGPLAGPYLTCRP